MKSMKELSYFVAMFLGMCFLIVVEESLQVNRLKNMFTFLVVKHSSKENGIFDTMTAELKTRTPSKVEDLKLSTRSSCEKTTNIVFLKTHKTGSSTITSIMNRFADIYDLRMLLPVKEYNRFFYPQRFSLPSVDERFLESGGKANMLANHARMNKESMEKVILPGTKFITLLRDPVSQFESSFYYFEFNKQLNLTQQHASPLNTFLEDPLKYYQQLMKKPKRHLTSSSGLIKNGMLYDLGFDHQQINSTEGIDTAVQKVEKEFDLVLITEYFDESLILFMRTFCWTLDDIMYLKQNARIKNKPNTISVEDKQRIIEWNKGDYELYKKFNQTFWRRIQAEGPTFWDDLKSFRQKRKQLKSICKLTNFATKAFKANVTIEKFRLSNLTNHMYIPFCKKLMMSEVEYLRYFRNKLGLSEA